jgi:hypothetical protein
LNRARRFVLLITVLERTVKYTQRLFGERTDWSGPVLFTAGVKRFGAVVLGCFCVSDASAQPQPAVSVSPLEGRSMVMPLYAGTNTEPAAIVRTDRIFTDYQRKGFFRIGLLPLAVLEGVQIEVRQPEHVFESLAGQDGWVNADASKRIELRRVKLLASQPSDLCLEAGSACPGAGGCLELREGVQFRQATRRVQAPRATLQITGPNAGRLVLHTSPPQTFFLFSDTQTNHQGQPE